MSQQRTIAFFALWLMSSQLIGTQAVFCEDKPPAQTAIQGPHDVSIVVRMQGPYDADVPLQIVCYFERTDTSDQKLFGAPVELDNRLSGVIASLRARDEFRGQAFETLLLNAPADTIKARQLLLMGLGSDTKRSLTTLESIGRQSLREAVRTQSSTVAFAPMIKDAGNDSLDAGEVETAIVRGMLLAYDTEKRLQSQGFATPFKLQSWIVEAGPTYYEPTIAGVKKAVQQASQLIEQRESAKYSSKSK